MHIELKKQHHKYLCSLFVQYSWSSLPCLIRYVGSVNLFTEMIIKELHNVKKKQGAMDILEMQAICKQILYTDSFYPSTIYI